jgi:purine-binding chemotaxis protein CheW
MRTQEKFMDQNINDKNSSNAAESGGSQPQILDERMRGISRTRGKYLVFTLEGKRYGVALSSVKEVIGMTEFTPVPGAPRFFKGLINLRGKIHSVIDLRIKLSLPEVDYQPKKTSIIIAEIGGFVIGTIVDDVHEVIGLETNQIERDLNISSDVSREYISGVAKSGTDQRELTLLLDIGKILSAEELSMVKQQIAS